MGYRRKLKTEAQKIGRRNRTRGHSFERLVAIMLRPVFPDARRHLEYQDAECFGVDLVNTGHYRIQCKKTKTYPPLNTIQEVQVDPGWGEVPILVAQADNQPALVVMPLTDLIDLLKRLKKFDALG